MNNLASIYQPLRDFAAAVTAKSSGSGAAGQPEEQLRGPFDTLLQSAGQALGCDVDCVGEIQLPNRLGRPDYAVRVGGVIVGYAELKAPGKGVTKARFAGHDLDQFIRFAQLPNLLYTDGNEWALYRSGQRERKIVRLAGDVAGDGAAAVSNANAAALLPLLQDFLTWQPHIPLTRQGGIDLAGLANLLAPLCRFLRDDVVDALQDDASPLNYVAAGWRRLLFPEASKEQFADAYAQTVAFALLLARSLGAGSAAALAFDAARDALRDQHNLLAAALAALTDAEVRRELPASLNALLRIIGAVPVAALDANTNLWLYFYEDFLAHYDRQLRKDAGVFYTPVPVVNAQVRLIDQLLVHRLGKPQGFAAPDVVTMDPAAGTGTYLLGVIEHTLGRIARQQGAGAVAGQATQLGQNLHGFEMMVGPYAVSDLRVTAALRGAGADLPPHGAPIYLTDTLESPHRQPPQGNFLLERTLAREQELALKVKQEVNVLVCLGNPPYDRHPAGSPQGAWVRYGDIGDEGRQNRPLLEDFIQPVKDAGWGKHLKNLYNLYVYFWRWALWKVFEQDDGGGPGIVSFISAASYLDGKAFAGMREQIRRLCDEVWILDLGGEGRGTRRSQNVFNIQTPVAIAIAYRKGEQADDRPARVHYARLDGTRDAKLAALDDITDFGSVDWQDCPSDWQAPFAPAGTGVYFDWPLLADLMPWQHSGVQLKRTWPISADAATLRRRWAALLAADDRAAAMRATDDCRVDLAYRTELLGYADATPISELAADAAIPPVRRYAYRFLDRQHIIADGRLISRPRPPLWDSYSDRQVYLMGRLTQLLGDGPALIASSLLLDIHYLGGGGKDVMPLYRDADAAEPNILPGLLELLAAAYGRPVSPEDFAAYLYGLLAQPSYTALYYAELATREVRVPLTKDAALFARAVELGAYLLHRHTYGQRYVPAGQSAGELPPGAARCTVAVPQDADGYPQRFRYDAGAQILHVGSGQFYPVAPAVYEYAVSGLKVVQSWLKYRMRDGAGRKSSPLDDIRPAVWPAQFTTELLELLWVLEATAAIQPEQAALLDAVAAGECFAAGDLPVAPAAARRAPGAATAAARLV